MEPPSESPPIRRRGLFAHSPWDAVPVLCALAHFAFVLLLFWFFTRLPWWALLPLGALYSISISWNINGISHNFLHNPYFSSPLLNRLFSLMESLTMGISQEFYTCVHMRHHMGNSDLQDEKGQTVDWLSIYRHGKNGAPEPLWRYVFLSYFRDDPKAIYQEIHRRNPSDARWGILEIVAFVIFYGTLFVLNWQFALFFIPFYYLGHCLSHLNGYFEHFGGNPRVPIAWGVSTYESLYNWTWFYNGYHAEHHFRPKMHWTKMRQLRYSILEDQKKAGTHVISPPHALGFLDKKNRSLSN
ncbi:MAG: fatty acid desaturase [Verrucomicrobiae bacterium]|nr:fatty acid desaturase [Verrucomicrobiae bacterium]